MGRSDGALGRRRWRRATGFGKSRTAGAEAGQVCPHATCADLGLAGPPTGAFWVARGLGLYGMGQR